jgi:hypothetical protein
MKVDYLTGSLTTYEKRALMLELLSFVATQIVTSYLFLFCFLQQGPTADRVISLFTAGYSLLQLNKNISLVYKKQQR